MAIKLIGRREHHNDLADVKALLMRPDFDATMFWEMADLLKARKVVKNLLAEHEIKIPTPMGKD